MDCMIQSCDVTVRADTGAGKSLCFQALALLRPGATVLVVSPLVGLVENQVIQPPTINKITADTMTASYNGTLDAKTKSKTLADLIKGDTRIVVCTDALGLGIDILDIKVVIQW
jgi:ATP-dependent DNA helicase RecQ